MRYLVYFILVFTLAACSCSEKELPNYGNKDLLDMARKGDPDLKLIIPKDISETLVYCSNYNPPCRYGIKAVVKRIEMTALFYEKQEDALKAAKRIKGYVVRNWVLDDVVGEPILERFVVKYLNAEKAEEISRASK